MKADGSGSTTMILRRQRAWRTTLAGVCMALAVGMRHWPAAAPFADAVEAAAGVFLGYAAADARSLSERTKSFR